jgi:hypothetical protein
MNFTSDQQTVIYIYCHDYFHRMKSSDELIGEPGYPFLD